MKMGRIVLFLLLIVMLVTVFGLGVYIGMTQFAPPPLPSPIATLVATAENVAPTSETTSANATEVAPNGTTGAATVSSNVTETSATTDVTQAADSTTSSLQDILNSELGIVLLATIGLLIVIVLGFILYFTVIQPQRKRRSLIQAHDHIINGTRDDLEKAEQLLVKALEAGMKDKDIRDARFNLGYVRARLNKNREASLVIADLKQMGKPDAETLYLDLYLQSHLEDYVKIEALYDEHRDKLMNFRDSNYLLSIGLFERGKYFWNQREIEHALTYFDRVRELGDEHFISLIPAKIEDNYIVFGIMALHAQNFEEAAKNFNDAIARATEKQLPNAEGRIGLILHNWVTRQDVNHTHQELEQIAKKLKQGSVEERKLLSVLWLWYALLELMLWRELPPKMGLPPDKKQTVLDLLARIRELDGELNDVDLMEGLLEYLFSKDDNNAKDNAVEKIQRSIEKGVNLAEVQQMVEQEVAVKKRFEQSTTEYLNLVKLYIQNQSIPEEHRLALKNYLSKYSQYRQVIEMDLQADEFAQEPTMEDIQNRSDLIRRRIHTLVSVKGNVIPEDGLKQIQSNINTLSTISQALQSKHSELEKNELALLQVTGQFLLDEEEGINSDEELEA